MLVESAQQLSHAWKHPPLDIQRAEVLTRAAIDVLFALGIRFATRGLGHDPCQPPAVGSDQSCDLIAIGGYPEFNEGLQPRGDPGLDRIHERSVEIEDPCVGLQLVAFNGHGRCSKWTSCAGLMLPPLQIRATLRPWRRSLIWSAAAREAAPAASTSVRVFSIISAVAASISSSETSTKSSSRRRRMRCCNSNGAPVARPSARVRLGASRRSRFFQLS